MVHVLVFCVCVVVGVFVFSVCVFVLVWVIYDVCFVSVLALVCFFFPVFLAVLGPVFFGLTARLAMPYGLGIMPGVCACAQTGV